MHRASWFEEAFGFDEGSYSDVLSSLRMEGHELVCPHKKWPRQHVGPFECASVEELRARVPSPASPNADSRDGISFVHISGNVTDLHLDPSNAGAVFQAASQFNCLEMVNPGVTPRQGISCYQYDRTQGPACAMACPAGTAFRNYLVGGEGQGKQQLNCLSGVEAALEAAAPGKTFWKMQNGYALPIVPDSMRQLGQLLSQPQVWDSAARELRVGVHWDTQVAPPAQHRVCQVYASAVPVSYAQFTDIDDFEPFATFVLASAYDATLLAARIKADSAATESSRSSGSSRTKVFLTMLGGGAFGNRLKWIAEAINKALETHAEAPLDVFLVSHGTVDPRLRSLMPERKNGKAMK